MTYLVCGEALIDLIKQQDGSWVAHHGGGPLNTAKALSRLGSDVEFLARISDDNFGLNLQDDIDSHRIGTSYLVKANEPTSLAVVEISESGAASYSFYLNETSNFAWREVELPIELTSISAIHIGTLALVMEPSAQLLLNWIQNLSHSIPIVIDLNVRSSIIPDSETYLNLLSPWLNLAHVVKASQEDLQFLYPEKTWNESAQSILNATNTAVVAVTLGEKGAAILNSGNEIFEYAPKVDVIDTVGAGDTFGAGLMFALQSRNLLDISSLQKIDPDQLQECLDFAVKAAALSCTKSGAHPPTLAEIEKLFNA